MLNKAPNNNDIKRVANIVLNEVPNNNDVKRVANIVLNEAPNSNDAMCLGKNVHLTAVGTQQFSMAAI